MATFIQAGTQIINLDHVIRIEFMPAHDYENTEDFATPTLEHMQATLEILTEEQILRRVEDYQGNLLGQVAVSKCHTFRGEQAERINNWLENHAALYKIF